MLIRRRFTEGSDSIGLSARRLGPLLPLHPQPVLGIAHISEDAQWPLAEHELGDERSV